MRDDKPLLDGSAKLLPGSYVVGVVFLSLFSDYCLLTIIVPIVPALLSERGIPDSWILVLFSSKAILQIVVNPFVGLLVDRYGSRWPLAAALLILSVSTAAFGAALEAVLGVTAGVPVDPREDALFAALLAFGSPADGVDGPVGLVGVGGAGGTALTPVANAVRTNTV